MNDRRPFEGNPHPWYGPCDALGFKEQCSECARLIFELYDELGQCSNYNNSFYEELNRYYNE